MAKLIQDVEKTRVIASLARSQIQSPREEERRCLSEGKVFLTPATSPLFDNSEKRCNENGLEYVFVTKFLQDKCERENDKDRETNARKVAEICGIDPEWMITYFCKPKLKVIPIEIEV